MLKTISDLLLNIPDLFILKDEQMSLHTTFKIGGPARLFLDAHSVDAALRALDILDGFGVSPLIVGNGSNLVVSDEGIDGVVLKLSCSKVSVSGNKIFAEAGATLSSVASIAQRRGLGGFEFAHGIPGSVGGALVMNAGAYGGEISQVLSKSTYVSHDGIFTIPVKEHNFGYRTSIYKQNPAFTVLSAEFSLYEDTPDAIASKMRELAERRRDKQPLEFPSAGSVFKRPEGHFAGALIEQCNLKGFSIGGAEVSEKHAGFIINRGDATADDVKRLVEHIKNTVLKETGVTLECEICFV
ncbi:MAG: UDP-N-acetylmuramate dehydrogenase [Oscillospiraceae bacterium]|nr:UDP-N-acetylmuramate dehydrogenase [Oscillospiraceae bacterium]MBQ3224231.1 UDP-N-acetylmuramate dehydrogenase [Oscillospiraceae bacterium]MBQ4316460.1 UDP-N-acetylmuramate dehydrogenase [Oscillospiraceae bacterium]